MTPFYVTKIGRKLERNAEKWMRVHLKTDMYVSDKPDLKLF